MAHFPGEVKSVEDDYAVVEQRAVQSQNGLWQPTSSNHNGGNLFFKYSQ